MTATPVTPSTELELARAALGADYEVIEELGRGGMAIVYRARERTLEREVAIKVLPAHYTFDESFVDRFQRESRIAAQLEHPHIVPVYRVGRSGRVIFFVMKLLRGQSLAERLSERGCLPVAEVRRILLEIASALGYAARRGVVHRDIKPDNIMLDDDGRCVVTDFGIARSASDQRLTATGMSVGTPRYMSPEQARAKPLDGRSDLYSLGIVAYQCLVGRTPFDGDDAFAILMDHIRAPVPRPALRSDDEWELFAVIERMLAKDPDDRFASADELIAALGAGAPVTGGGAAYRPRARTASPTAGIPPVRDSAGAERTPSSPQASPALDRALAAGIDLIRRQRPRVEAGMRALRNHQPRAAGTLAGVRSVGRDLRERARGGVSKGARQARRLVALVAGRERRLTIGAGAVVALSVLAYYAVHFATKHRSRCPGPESSLRGGADTGATGPRPVVAPARAPALSLMVDAVGMQSAGSDLDVYYDVCGLQPRDSYTARIVASRNESGLRRLLGTGVVPVTTSYDETANGAAVRRHRTLDAPHFVPGSYRLDVVVTDARGRTRTKSVPFQLGER